MEPERWLQIERLYHEAGQLAPSERSLFLDKACGADQELRSEVESLLKFEEKTAGFIEVPALEIAAEQFSDFPESFGDCSLVGQTIDHYRVLEELGSGGTGVVYKARDEHLDRFVALKVLRSNFAVDSKRLDWLRKEARSASALNHPNVVTVYEIGEVSSNSYISMEWVEGKTLRQMLTSGPLAMPTILHIAEQLATALEKMHAAGWIHRDLKPENVMITLDGLAKILDFGLAKVIPEPTVLDDASRHAEETELSYLAATLAYMAPERIRGQTDSKSDQFSLGCVLFEMATGKAAFRRNSTEETLSAIANDEVEALDTIRADVPFPFSTIVDRCLAKRPEERFPSTESLLKELRSVHRAEAASKDDRRFPWGSAPVLIACLTVLAIVATLLFNASKPHDWFQASPSGRIRSLVVLPLENLSKIQSDDYFADGMTEELIAQIGQTMSGQLKVTSRDTTMRYKQTPKSLQQIADELKVDAVLQGAVLLEGENARITAKLVRTATQEVVWTNTYAGSAQDVLEMQRRAARDIAAQIHIKLTPDNTELERAGKIDVNAHQDYLTGLYHFNNRFHSGAEGLAKSVDFFNQAIQRAPGYAPAYAALANSYLAMGFFGLLVPPDAHQAAKENALKSLDLDPNDVEAHVALGRIRTSYEWDWPGAEAEFKRAIELNSNYSLAYQWYAILLVVTGRANEGLAVAQRGLDQDELSLPLTSGKAWLSYLARRYDDSIQKYKRALEIDPVSLQEIDGLAEAYEMAGRTQEAFDEYQKWGRAGGMTQSEIGQLERSYHRGGLKAYWRRRLNMEVEDEKHGDVWTYVMASLYARVGNKEQALTWLEKAYNERHDRLILLKVDPVFDSLKSDSRFWDLVKRVGLP